MFKRFFMKFLMLLIFLSFANYIKGQLPKNPEGYVVFEGLIEVASISKQHLFQRSKFWMASYLKTGNDIVEIPGPDQNIIICTGTMYLPDIQMVKSNDGFTTQNNILNFTCVIYSKDGKVRYKLLNFLLKYGYTAGAYTSVSTNLENLKVPDYLTLNKKYNEEIPRFRAELERNIQSSINNLLDNLRSTLLNEENW